MHPRLLLHICFLLFGVRAVAQFSDSSFIRYTVKDGLTDNYIRTIQQDDWGYMWIGTDNGLNRFDGYNFKNFYQGNTELPLPSNTIWRLLSFGDHRLGIVSLRGFQLLNTRNYSVTNFFVPDSTSFVTLRNSALDAVHLPNDQYAVATATGVYQFDSMGHIVYQFEKYVKADAGNKRVLYARRIIPLDDKRFLVHVEDGGLALYDPSHRAFAELDSTGLSREGIYNPPKRNIGYWIDQFSLGKGRFLFVPQNDDHIIYNDLANGKTISSPLPFKIVDEINWLSRICQLDDSSFAINSMHSGFFVFHLDNRSGHISFDKERYLSNYRISCLFKDRDHRLWIGTRKGLLYQKISTPFIKSYHYPVKLPDNPVNGFADAFRYKNKLYVARNSRYNGLVVIDTASMKIEKQLQFYGDNSPWNEVYTMQMYHPDTLWLSTNGGLLWLDVKTLHYGKLLDPKTYPIAFPDQAYLNTVDKKNNAWFCYLMDGVVIRYNTRSRNFNFFTATTDPSLPFFKVKSIVTDAFGDTWIGGHGLARWNERLQRFDTLISVYGGVNKFNDDILALEADSRGSLWMHNTDNGLLEFRIREKQFVAYTMNDGLPSAQIRCLSPVINNTIWLGGANELTAFNTLTKKVIVYDHNDGLPEEFPSSRKILYDSGRDKCYLLCGDFLAEFPANLSPPHSNPRQLLIPEIDFPNRGSIFFPSDTITLPYQFNTVNIQFTLVNFESPDTYRFEYRVNNSSKWIRVRGQRAIALTELAPGSYSVTIKVTGKYGDESIRTLLLLIKPPFWKASWFIALAVLALITFLWLIYRYRINQVRQRADLDRQLAETEMRALQSQMNPHFIFNSLNSIREMILHNEIKESSVYLSKFAQLIRMALDQSNKPVISLRSTIDYLQRYVEIEKIRNADFNYTITATEDLDQDDVFLSPTFIQPFIENAIWHGTGDSSDEIEIDVKFKRHSGQLVCTIEDNGIGIARSQEIKAGQPALHQSIGISNVRDRIRLLNQKHGLENSVTILDKNSIEGRGTGTLVTLYLPLETTRDE